MIAVAWGIRNDHDQYMAARRLQLRHRSRWLVMWGPGSRAFFAFYRGHAHVVPLSAPTDQELHRRILRTEAILATTTPSKCLCLDVTCAGPPERLPTTSPSRADRSTSPARATRRSAPSALSHSPVPNSAVKARSEGPLEEKHTFTRNLSRHRCP